MRRPVGFALVLLALAGRAPAAQECNVQPAPAVAVLSQPVPARTAVPGDTVRLTVAAFVTPEAEAAALALGRPVGEFVAEAFTAWNAVLAGATRPGDPPVVAVALGLFPLPLDETGDCAADLDAFFAHPRAHAVRDSLRANLAFLFSARCGGAYQCVEGTDCAATAFASAPFNVAGPSRQALAHEAGHLLGMRHDIGSDPTPGENHGLRDEAAGFFTVMAFRGPLPREALVAAYSDPDRLYQGVPLGVPGVANNAAVLRRVAPLAATWNETGVGTEGPAPAEAFRAEAFPNPFRDRLAVRVEIGRPAALRLALFDARGRRVRHLDAAAGTGRDLVLDTWGLAPGPYLLRVTTADATHTQTLRLTRAR